MLNAIEDRVITMEPEEAREQLREYRREIHKRADAEYEAIAEGLEQIAEGRRLVDVREAIIAGGFHEDGRPRLAIARADRRQVRCDWSWNGRLLTLATSARGYGQQGHMLDLSFSMHAGERPAWERVETNWGNPLNTPSTGHALVPIIPAKVRRESGVRPSYDRDHHILFEVEEWSDTPLRAEPDRDPYLLRHLGGDLYVIMGEWDLTPLEMAIMAGRRDQ